MLIQNVLHGFEGGDGYYESYYEIINIISKDDNSLVAHYKFDGDFTDSSGNGYDLTGGSGNTDIIDNYKSYVANNGNIKYMPTDITQVIGNRNWTISWWGKALNDGSSSMWFGLRTATSEPWDDIYCGMYTYDSGNPRFLVSIDNDRNTARVNLSTSITDGDLSWDTWYYYTLTFGYYDEQLQLKVYINGILKETQIKSVDLVVPYLITDPLQKITLHENHIGNTLGGYSTKTLYYSDFKIYNKVLTVEQINLLYKATPITYAGGGGGMGSTGESATSTSGGKGGIGIYHSLNPYGISYEYGAGGNAIGDNTLLQPNYGLYSVLPWNQHNLKDIKNIVSFKVWNQTTSKYELPTIDFVFDKELMDMSKTPNYTGLYSFVDTDDEYYFYTFKYLDTIPAQTFEYKLTADGMTAYIFEKSHDRKTYVEGNNKDITIYVDDTIKFINESGGHSLAIKDSVDIATESETITEYTFNTAGDYSYYCVSHPVMTGKITVIDKPTDNYDNSLGQTAYQLDIKRNVNADILIVGGGGAGGVANGGGGGGGGVLYATNIKLNGNYIIKIGDGGKSAEPRGANTYQNINSTNGYSSIFGKTGDLLEVFGGGYGGNANYSGTTSIHGNMGGSGGGGSYNDGNGGIKQLPTYNTFITSTNSIYYGGIGGTSYDYIGGGGGGASEITPTNYNGADGIQINIDGNNYYYGGGGGGIYWDNTAGNGGLGGGGGGGGLSGMGGNGGTGGRTNGENGTGSGTSGSPQGIGGNGGSGTGGGGGGDSYNATIKGGNGGSGIVIIRFSKLNIENVLTNFGRGANAGQLATPGLLVLKTDNNQILTTETTKHPKLPYSYVWSGKTDTDTDQVLVKSTEDFTIPTNLTLTFWYYESVNDDEKTEIIKITDELKVSSTTTELVFTVGDSNVNIPRPNKYEWNFYGLIFDGTDMSVYVNDMLVKSGTVGIAPTGSGKITLGISTSGVAKIADYRIYESIDVANITEQYSSLGNVGILDVFRNHLTEYDIKENKAGKGYLSLNQNNVKTKIFNNEGNVVISYKFKGIEEDKYYPIIQFTDYINGIIVPKVEITMKTNKLFVSVMINNSLIEKEYVVNCTTLKLYSITINNDKTIVVLEDNVILTHTPIELIGLYSFENNDTKNDQIIENIVGESILSNMTICNIELSTKIISGITNQNYTEIITNNQTYHYYEIKESGSMTFAKETRVDMLLVGGGAGGGASNVGTEYYGEPGEVNVISTYLKGTYQIEIGSGGESNMPGTKSTIVNMNTGLEVYSANGGLTNVEYIDTTYSNVYSTYDFGDGEKEICRLWY